MTETEGAAEDAEGGAEDRDRGRCKHECPSCGKVYIHKPKSCRRKPERTCERCWRRYRFGAEDPTWIGNRQ